MGNLSRVLSTLIIPNPHSYLTPCTQVGVHMYSTCVHTQVQPPLSPGRCLCHESVSVDFKTPERSLMISDEAS